jgi:hypothetical protein
MDNDIKTYRDDMTLGDIAVNDKEMQDVAIRNANRYFFVSMKRAAFFIGDCLKKTLDRLGVRILEGMHPKFVDRMLTNHKVEVENRKHYEGQDAWKQGLYIYKDGELVTFISTVVEGRPDGALIWSGDRDNAKFSVITNAKI